MPKVTRCPWVNLSNPIYIDYHDLEWGVPVHDDVRHFYMLTLEGAQAGLNWETILKKREHYVKCFAEFQVNKIAKFSGKKVEKILTNPGIIRNRLKVESVIKNAKAFLAIQKEYGSFDNYIWGFVDYKPIVNDYKNKNDYPSKTTLSDTISKDLKKKGFSFVGSTIVYAFMQAIGLVNDHSVNCFKRHQKGWSLYIIKTNNDTLYTGITKDIAARFKQHNEQGPYCAKYLKGKLPLSIVYSEFVGNHSDALKREHQVKKLSRAEKTRLIEDNYFKKL